MTEDAKAEAGQRQILREIFDAALGAAQVEGKLERFLPSPPRGRTIVVGAGKAAAAMAAELDRIWPGNLSGAVVTRHGYELSGYDGRIEVLTASHPVPDYSSVAAGERISALVGELGADDLVIALISGGASSLLVGLPEGVTLEDKQGVTRALLASGASIGEINSVRKQLSTLKGGGLARLAGPARIVTLAVSDIPGDAIAAIGSGPTIIDNGSRAGASAILARYKVPLSPAIERHLSGGDPGASGPGSDDRSDDIAHVVLRSADIMAAAAEVARKAGFEPILLGDDLEGEARELGSEHARLALRLLGEGRRACLISGGETTVTVRARGRGGRNGEYLLGAVVALDGVAGIAAVAGDTDGIDGSEENAGAMAFASSAGRASALGFDARRCLDGNDSYGFFAAAGDLLVTGPTCTNVNDFRAILIDPAISGGGASRG